MNEGARAPWHLWAVGLLSLAWNGFGAADYTMSQLGDRNWFAGMGFSEEQTIAVLQFLADSPMWTHAAWAFGVWGAVVGSVLLLLRNRLAVWAFAISLAGAVLGLINQKIADYPPELAEMQGSPVMYGIVAIAILLLWYAIRMKSSGVIR